MGRRKNRSSTLSGLGVGVIASFAASPALAQSSFARATEMNWDGALTGIFLGLLLFSTAYNLAFFVILRERFLVWQMLRSSVYFALCIGLSPLAMGAWLSPEGVARQVYINVLFDLGIVLTGPFLRAYLEPGMLDKWLDRCLVAICCLIPLTTPAMLLADCPPAYMAFRNTVLVAYLVVSLIVVGQALMRGSRVARYQLAAWSGLILVFGTSLFHDIVLGRSFEMLLFALFPALGLEAILTAIGISDRLIRLRRGHDEAQAAAQALTVIAHTDALTGLPNRRAIEAAFAERRPVALAILDLDRFKGINDRYGHDMGDRVIFAAGAALASGSAMAGRLGGEEFVLLLYGDAADAMLEAERLRTRISGYVCDAVAGLDEPVTASMGIADAAAGAGFEAMLKIADINLYAAKAQGRNRMVAPMALAA